jgi:hypothetical protein
MYFDILDPVGPMGPGPGPMVGRSDARTVGRSDGRTDGRSDGRTVGRTDGRTFGRSWIARSKFDANWLNQNTKSKGASRFTYLATMLG